MGLEVIAMCECGLDVIVLIGGGMTNFITTCYFPCLCEACHNIVQVNLLKKTMKCPKYKSSDLISYDDPRLSEFKGQHEVAIWRIFKQGKLARQLLLTDGYYMCPNCNKLSLRFQSSDMCWD